MNTSDKKARIVLENAGRIDPLSIKEYMNSGGYEALKKALSMQSSAVVDEVKRSGLRGRGGAGFPTGLKWSFTAPLQGQKYILCNADEGEPGTFKDRLVMEGDPHKLIEGMIIAGYAIGASEGFIYIRGEYYASIEKIEKAIAAAEAEGLLCEKVLGKEFAFKLSVRKGAGAYVCGEETALIESMEGKRGNPRVKPPFPGVSGLWGRPTVVNNVETLANIPYIIKNGADAFRKIGTEKSPGTKVFLLSGKVKEPKAIEAPMGTTLRQLIYDLGGGLAGGIKFKCALVGGAAGAFLGEDMLDVPMDYDNLLAKGAVLGSGVVMVLSEKEEVMPVLKNLMEFFVHESCGQCAPCRTGNKMILDLLGRIEAGKIAAEKGFEMILKAASTMKETSLCALGQSPILPISSALKYYSRELTIK